MPRTENTITRLVKQARNIKIRDGYYYTLIEQNKVTICGDVSLISDKLELIIKSENLVTHAVDKLDAQLIEIPGEPSNTPICIFRRKIIFNPVIIGKLVDKEIEDLTFNLSLGVIERINFTHPDKVEILVKP